MLRIETGLILVALLVSFVRPGFGSLFAGKCEKLLSLLAQRQQLSVLAIGITALVVRAAFLPILQIPEPIVHDEFGYLLAADTFAHGRLANPTPPMWQHFETFHVMFLPTYASIYPPAQGLVLFAGTLIARNPYWGVWFSVGAMCAAITWMLQGWLSPEWALLGGVLAILRYGIFGYWANSYWGGAVAAIGGALALGALPRVKKCQPASGALMMGIGLAILANSRPYEGFVLSIPIALAVLAWLWGLKRAQFPVVFRKVILPLLTVLTIAAGGTSYYFWRTTGSPVRMPYQIERHTYAIAPYMMWQSVRPEPLYHHAVMRKMFVEEEMLGRKDSTLLTGLLLRTYLTWSFFLGPALSFPLLMLLIDLPRNLSFRSITLETKVLLVTALLFGIGSMLVNFYSPHYSAPATGLILALVLISIRQLRYWNSRGLFLARCIPLVCILSIVARAAAGPFHIPLSEFYENAWYQSGPSSFGKSLIKAQLEKEAGKHVVIVRYAPDHAPFREWVYNDADIDNEKVVWARGMDAADDQELLQYFSGRHAWILQADEHPPKLSPYTPVVAEGSNNGAVPVGGE